jgi:hypothetical protein
LNRKIVSMQTDGGGEYQKLISFFSHIGISHLVSCPHTDKQNGAAEHKHRHIVEVGFALPSHASMLLKFWDEAYLTVVFLSIAFLLVSFTWKHLWSICSTINLIILFSKPSVVRVGLICVLITRTSLLFDPQDVFS